MQLDFDTIFIKKSHFKSRKFFKVLCSDYSNFGTKTAVYCLVNIKIQLKS